MNFSRRGVYYWRRFASQVAPFKTIRSRVKSVVDEEIGFQEQTTGNPTQADASCLNHERSEGYCVRHQNGDHWSSSQAQPCTTERDEGVLTVSSAVNNASSECSINGAFSVHALIERTFECVGVPFDDNRQLRPKSSKCHSTYFEIYLKLMYITCLSPFKPENASGGLWDYHQIFRIIQLDTVRTLVKLVRSGHQDEMELSLGCTLAMGTEAFIAIKFDQSDILYWIATCLSISKALTAVKLYCFIYINDGAGGLENFMDMGFYIMNVFTKTYSAYLSSFHQSKLSKLLLSTKRLNAFTIKYSKTPQPLCKYQTTRVWLLGLASLAASVFSTVFTELSSWSAKKEVLENSHVFSIGVFVWSPEDLHDNSTTMVSLHANYGTNITTQSVIFGTTFMLMTFLNRIVTCATGDLILLTAIMLQQHVCRLAKDVGNHVHDAKTLSLQLFEADDGKWAHYKMLKQTVDCINEAMDGLLKYMHVDNVTLFVYFALNVFDGEMPVFLAIYFTYNIIKTSCTYRIATNASGQNDTFLKWIRRIIWKSRDKGFIAKSHAILHEIEKEPIGLGKGQFLINESFMFRFLGTVGSVFVLKAQSRETAGE